MTAKPYQVNFRTTMHQAVETPQRNDFGWSGRVYATNEKMAAKAGLRLWQDGKLVPDARHDMTYVKSVDITVEAVQL